MAGGMVLKDNHCLKVASRSCSPLYPDTHMYCLVSAGLNKTCPAAQGGRQGLGAACSALLLLLSVALGDVCCLVSLGESLPAWLRAYG